MQRFDGYVLICLIPYGCTYVLCVDGHDMEKFKCS
jgi:hypothetical protein